MSQGSVKKQLDLNQLNYNHLYYFWVIAQEGSVAKACKRLHLSQSTVSAQLIKLEETIGKQLFVREGRSLELSNFGRQAIDYADDMFESARGFAMIASGDTKKLPPQFRVGIVSSLPEFTVHDFLLPLMKDSSIYLSIEEGSFPFLLKELGRNSFDLIISDAPSGATHKKKYMNTAIEELNLSILAHPKFVHLKKKFPRSLNDIPMIILGSLSGSRWDIEDFFQQNQITENIVGEVNDITLLRQFALSGVGLIPAPKRAFKEEIRRGQLVEIGKLPEASYRMWAISRRKRSAPILKLLKRLK